jgi:hypothetical protein
MDFVTFLWAGLIAAGAGLPAAAIGVLGMNPARYRDARLLFWLSGLSIGAIALLFGLTIPLSILGRILGTGAIGALAAIVAVEGTRWISHVESTAETTVASTQANMSPPIRLPRPLAYERTDLETEANGQDAIITGFRLLVHNNGTETLLWRVKYLTLSLDGSPPLAKVGESSKWPIPGARLSDCQIKFDRPLGIAHNSKKITVEVEISYDNDPPLGIRTIWQKIEYPIAWFDTQAPLFNTVNVVEHREGP